MIHGWLYFYFFCPTLWANGCWDTSENIAIPYFLQVQRLLMSVDWGICWPCAYIPAYLLLCPHCTACSCSTRVNISISSTVTYSRCLVEPQTLSFIAGLSTCHFAWAFHSEAEEELLNMIPAMQRGDPQWSELRAVGVGWWIRNINTLRKMVEKVSCKKEITAYSQHSIKTGAICHMW